MTIRLNDIADQQKFISQHHVHTRTVDHDELYILTGVVVVEWKTKVTGSGWNRESDLQLYIKVPGIPAGRALRLRQWAPFLTLNAVSNDGPSNNAGWAVDKFDIIQPNEPIQLQVGVKLQMAGRDSDGWIHRIGYHITLLGQFEVYTPPPGPF